MSYHFLDGFALFELFVFVDALLDENPFERCEMEQFSHFGERYLKLFAQELAGCVDIMAQHVADSEEVGLLV